MKIFQSYLGQSQKKYVSVHAIPYDIEVPSSVDHREYELFKNLHKKINPDSQAWGLVSWKFNHKTPVDLGDFIAYAQQMFSLGADCVFINPMIGNEAIFLNVWEQWAYINPNVRIIHEHLENQGIGSLINPEGVSSFSFCNYFIATPRFWAQYFQYVDGVIEDLENISAKDHAFGKIYRGSASYQKNLKLSMRPFVIERLITPFIARITPLKSASYPFSLLHYEKKFGIRIGKALHELSKLKNKAIKLDDFEMLKKWDSSRKKFLSADNMSSLVMQMDDPSDYFLSDEFHGLGK